MRRSLRPQLSLEILLFGMVLLASAAMWLGEAIAMGVVGLGVMIWAVAQILKELIRRPPDHA